jgi:hypothetical protein
MGVDEAVGGVTLTAATLRFPGSALLAAVTWTGVAIFTFGAVKSPVDVTVPAEADQVTPELLALETLAEN